MYDYSGLLAKLKERGLKKTYLTEKLGISSRTVAKIKKGEKLSNATLEKLCDYLSCSMQELYREVCDNPILQILREEMENKISGGLYHETQVRLTYNSNRIEGSKLTEEQTRMIFETNTVDVGDGVPVDDIIETANHFRAVDYMIAHAEEDLNEGFIKELHKILKTATKDATLPWFAVGEYKKRPNTVGGRITTKPAEVAKAVQSLLKEYLAKETSTFEDIVDLHFRFECIHPFQDGNGRVGRLIAFKECLKHNIIPFIIEGQKKIYYYRGLREYENERGFLVETCYDGQDTYKALINYFME